jgi:hypothetical protein
MRNDLLRLYGALTRARPPAVDADAQLESRQSTGLDGVPGATVDHMPLLPEQVDQLERLYRLEPDGIREFLGTLRGQGKVPPATAERMIAALRRALEAPATTEAHLEGLFARDAVKEPPPGFTFDLYDKSTIPINTNRRDFQDDDWLGYGLGAGLNGALFHTGLLPLGPIRRHEDYGSLFSYDLTARPGQDLRVALFADFANGYYHSRYIAKRFAKEEYPYAIHLGDVYYAGREDEVRSYLAEPLKPMLDKTELFLIAGNHEMYSKGRPWLAYIDGKRHPERQRQEGTYFRLLRDKFQIIGIDTEWFGHLKYREPWLDLWLANALNEGRRQGRINILLSTNEPYCYGKPSPTGLHGDLKPLLDEGLVDLWFWGNTHYCALFNRSAEFPFVGSCIGHGGYPYGAISAGKTEPVPPRFVEDGTRFGGGAWTDPRPDMGNNGYCELVLAADGTIGLVYIDWRGRTRHEARLARGGNGQLDFVQA